jgi:hypothetical protein
MQPMRRSAFRRLLLVVALVAAGGMRAGASLAAEPDYAEWNRLLAGYYDPAHGMDYAGLKAREAPAMHRLQQVLARVDVASLTRPQQLAYWLNLYNVNIVTRVVDGYPTASIRDLSTDPVIRLNVFKKETVPFASGKISLNDIENDRVRAEFKDPRVHFALNCAAKSCPPLRVEAYVGARVGDQLDDQVRKFLGGPGLRIEQQGDRTILHVVKILDWFAGDFDKEAGGRLPFLMKHMPPETKRLVPTGVAAANIELAFDDYDWSLNDWKR